MLMLLRNQKRISTNNHNPYRHCQNILNVPLRNVFRYNLSFVQYLLRKSSKNKAKGKFVRVQPNGWFLF